MAQTALAGNSGSLAGWVTILRSYGPSLLIECQRAQELSKSLVIDWLQRFMFANESDASIKAKAAADYFADYKTHYSHGRAISREQARDVAVHVSNLEDDQGLQEAVLSAHHAVMHTLSGTAAAKIVENNRGSTFLVMRGQAIQIVQPPGQPQPAGPTPPPAPAPLQGNRQARRARH